MTRTTFIHLSGWSLIVAALCPLATFFPRPESGDKLPFLFAIVLITFGLVGIRARYGEKTGNAGKIALSIGIFGGGASVVSFLLWAGDVENARIMMNVSMGIMFGGLFVFGLIAQSVKPMPRGNWLPALAGFWWLFLVISAYVFPPVNRQNVPDWASLGIFLMMALFLAMLGYVLQADAQPEKFVA